MNLQNFYLTFGQKYRSERHPATRKNQIIHPDGYVKIRAEDIGTARKLAFSRFGNKWAFLYTEYDFVKIKNMYPFGELFTIKQDGGKL